MYRLVGRAGSAQLTQAAGSGIRQRGLAVPVNKRSSVDPLLGVAPPQAPKAQDDEATASSSSADTLPNFLADLSRRNNPNDLSELLRGSKLPGFQRNNGNRSKTAAAIGALRRGAGSAIPTQDLEDAFLPPSAPGAAPAADQQGSAEASVDQTPLDRETPHPIDAFYGRNDLDERILAAARAVHHARTSGNATWTHASTLSSLMKDFNARIERTLSVELPNESRPKEDRKVPLTSATSSEVELSDSLEDGVLLIAYVTGLTGARGNERISVCSGFAVEGGDRLAEGESSGKGALVVTIAHTLRGSLPTRPKGTPSKSSDEEASIALAITRRGEIFPITSLLSSLPTSDLILLQLGEEAIVGGSEESALGAPLTTSPAKIRTLPLSPYPAQIGTELCVSSFWGWEDDAGSTLPAFEFHAGPELSSGSSENGLHVRSSAALTISSKTIAPPAGREKEIVKQERDDAGRSRWGRTRLVEYRDAHGQEALPGTYDELAQLDFKLLAESVHNPPALQQRAQNGVAAFPVAGSSGGPIVDCGSRAVVGIVAGNKASLLGGSRGYGIPAEKVFYFFALPGFPKK